MADFFWDRALYFFIAVALVNLLILGTTYIYDIVSKSNRDLNKAFRKTSLELASVSLIVIMIMILPNHGG